MAQLAQQRSQNPQIQRFAHEILTEQARTGSSLSELAKRRQFEMPPTELYPALRPGRTVGAQPNSDAPGVADRAPDRGIDQTAAFAISPEERQELARLQSLSGVEFDRAFMKTIVADRERRLRQFGHAAQTMEDAELRRFAAERIPTLHESHRTAIRWNQMMGGIDSAPGNQPNQPGGVPQN